MTWFYRVLYLLHMTDNWRWEFLESLWWARLKQCVHTFQLAKNDVESFKKCVKSLIFMSKTFVWIKDDVSVLQVRHVVYGCPCIDSKAVCYSLEKLLTSFVCGHLCVKEVFWLQILIFTRTNGFTEFEVISSSSFGV